MQANALTRNRVAVALLAVLAAALAYAAAAAPAAHAETTAALKRSTAHPPAISKVTFKTLKRGRVAATFRVRYPRIGRRTSERAYVRMHVYKDVFQQERIATSRRYGGKLSKRLKRYRIVISRKAATKRLRRALRKKSRAAGQRAARNLVIVSVAHRRNLDRDRAVDHSWAQAGTGHGSIRRPPKKRAKSSIAWPGSGTITIQNSLGGPVLRLSALQGSCMAQSGITAINASNYLGSEEKITATMQPYNTREAAIPFVGKNPTALDTFASERAAEGVLSTLARKFAFEVWNYFAIETPVGFHGAAPRYKTLIDDKFPNSAEESCGTAKNNLFVLGFDNLGNYRHGAQLLNFDGNLSTVATLAGGQLNTNPIPGIKNSIQVSRGAISGQPQPCPTYEWMTCVFPPPGNARPARDASLNKVVWPGAHDSGTSSMSTDLEDLATTGGPSCGGGSKIVSSVETAVRKYVPGIANAADNVVLPIVTSKVQALAIAQPASIREMLDAGVRYLDLRVGYDPKQGRWRFVHSMYSRGGIENDLHDIANWAKNHPTEIVIVNFNTICDTDNNSYPHLPALQSSILNDEDLAGNVSICDRTYPSQNLPTDALPSLTLQQIRNTKNNIVLMMESGIPYTQAFKGACGPSLNNSNHKIHSFFGVDDPQRLASCGGANLNPGTGPSSFAACMGLINLRIAQLPFVAQTRGIPDPADSAHPAGYSMTNSLAPVTLKNWRATPRFVLTDMHYEQITNEQIASAILDPSTSLTPSGISLSGTLYGWDRPLLPGYSAFSRQEIMNSWGSCANILMADDVRADALGTGSGQQDAYVNQAVQINLNPAAHPCQPPPG